MEYLLQSNTPIRFHLISKELNSFLLGHAATDTLLPLPLLYVLGPRCFHYSLGLDYSVGWLLPRHPFAPKPPSRCRSVHVEKHYCIVHQRVTGRNEAQGAVHYDRVFPKRLLNVLICIILLQLNLCSLEMLQRVLQTGDFCWV